MAKTHPKYTPEFRRQMVELVRAGRNFSELSNEFGSSLWSIRYWVKQADRDAGLGDGALTTAERQELMRLRRENRQLKIEREILSKAAAWFANESTAAPKRPWPRWATLTITPWRRASSPPGTRTVKPTPFQNPDRGRMDRGPVQPAPSLLVPGLLVIY